MAITYKDAGVDIEEGARLVDAIAPLARATARPEVLGGIGGFAGLCALPPGYRQPILVSSTDGVGTKLKSALATGRHRGIGIDLVAMSVNDVIVTGADPLLFLDYFATSRLELAVAREVVAGIAEGCTQAGCALVGGETAEMPGIYSPGDYDVAGFCVGVVERDQIPSADTLQAGDLVIGLPSSGLHANGHSLARKLLLERFSYDDAPAALAGQTIADVLLQPTLIYAWAFAALREAGLAALGAAHITGGGLIENPPRLLRTSTGAERDDLALRFDTDTWQMPAVMQLIAEAGVEEDEMRRTFNMGIGMVLVVRAADAERVLAVLGRAEQAAGERAPRVIGALEARPAGAAAVRFAP
ncbi:phosphoribosylformylglycinamidine cyclo-ligase [Haliangium ochraceum]|uniref:Phosphoribosylformylglycinamidine cyclo-ligase n=1 Tax=Haliangium ochraceum (strain DSM 14365 / JCM 11303 / SMP-2) TaxID=502025 RepID=D0LYA9_HALO1|nr:phosphoribosylformylglycinamidine cyclo-ligase [Haliangium ochraceum DSM 14365]